MDDLTGTEIELRIRASESDSAQSRPLVDKFLSFGHRAGALLGLTALALLALRAGFRLELRWDTFWYHIPFAARRAGLGIPYEMPPLIRDRYDGFPPLPELIQGLLWRITGSINATGTINILALAGFIYFCHRKLKAPFSVVAILSLTTPLIVIHAASSYVDLFSNALLAVGVTSLIAMMLCDRSDDCSLLGWGLAGLIGASWSKTLLIPVVFPCLLCCTAVYAVRAYDRRSRKLLLLVLGACVLSAVPYARNAILFGNPLWPVRMPVWADHFPYTLDTRPIRAANSPPPLTEMSQAGLFLHSVLEIDHPTSYPARERWTIDQGNAWMAYRSGGFWNVALLTDLSAMMLLVFFSGAQKRWLLLGSMVATWLLVAFLPQSHELRYYLFLPLTTAATIGMLWPRFRRTYPVPALLLVAIFIGEFSWMVYVNHNYYKVERIGYTSAALSDSISSHWWPTLREHETYCAVGFEPVGIILTGPTMKEFHIIDRSDIGGCPPNVKVLIAR